MKRAAPRRVLLLVAIVTTLTLAIPGAFGASGSGTVKAGHAGAYATGVTEWDFFLNRCDQTKVTTNGVDGLIIPVSPDTHLRVTGSPSSLAGYSLSVNVVFYKKYGSECFVSAQVINSGTSDVYRDALGGQWAVVSVEGYGPLISPNGNCQNDCEYLRRSMNVPAADVTINWRTCSPNLLPPAIPTYCYP